jgi:hypothetical protein
MDFNTGTGGTGSTGGSPSGPGGTPPRVSAGAAGGEFNYQDPVQSFISTVQRVVLQPVDFFRDIRRRGDFINPLVFALVCAVISAVLGGIIGLFISVAAGQRGLGGAILSFIGSVIGAPIGAAVGLFIWSGILHLLVMLLVKPDNAGFEATFRVNAYTSAVQLVSWIPFIGWLIAFVWAIILSILGIREVHSTTTGTAALVVLIPVVVFGGLVLLIIGAALFAVFFGTR